MSFYSYDKQFKSFHQTQIPNVLKTASHPQNLQSYNGSSYNERTYVSVQTYLLSTNQYVLLMCYA